MPLDKQFEESLNTELNASNKKKIAIKMLKGTVDAGKAIVSILEATGIAGFRFHVPESEMIKLENDVTDHYIENNTAVQDHIAQRPVSITLTGYVGEYFYSNHKIMDTLSAIVSTVRLVSEFLPTFSSFVQGVKKRQLATLSAKMLYGDDSKLTLKEKFNILKEEIDLNNVDLFALMQSLYKFTSAQTRAFLFFEALWKARKLFTVETSWKRYDNMVIQSIQARRDNNADITEFSVTFKQLAFTQTLTESIQEYTNRMEQQRAKVTNKGLVEGQLTSLSNLGFENPLVQSEAIA